jgi:hypothetical protein
MRPFQPRRFWPVLAGPALLVLCSCGGSGAGSSAAASSYATTLSYVNPPLSGYSLQAASGNNTSHLVLNLVGPSGSAAQGVSFFLSADPSKVAWSKGTGTPSYATPGNVFNLGATPQAFVTSVSAAGVLQVGIFQKGGTATFGSAPIVTLALDLAATTLAPGTSVALTVPQQAVYVDGTGTVKPFATAIAVGTLVAN